MYELCVELCVELFIIANRNQLNRIDNQNDDNNDDGTLSSRLAHLKRMTLHKRKLQLLGIYPRIYEMNGRLVNIYTPTGKRLPHRQERSFYEPKIRLDGGSMNHLDTNTLKIHKPHNYTEASSVIGANIDKEYVETTTPTTTTTVPSITNATPQSETTTVTMLSNPIQINDMQAILVHDTPPPPSTERIESTTQQYGTNEVPTTTVDSIDTVTPTQISTTMTLATEAVENRSIIESELLISEQTSSTTETQSTTDTISENIDQFTSTTLGDTTISPEMTTELMSTVNIDRENTKNIRIDDVFESNEITTTRSSTDTTTSQIDQTTTVDQTWIMKSLEILLPDMLTTTLSSSWEPTITTTEITFTTEGLQAQASTTNWMDTETNNTAQTMRNSYEKSLHENDSSFEKLTTATTFDPSKTTETFTTERMQSMAMEDSSIMQQIGIAGTTMAFDDDNTIMLSDNNSNTPLTILLDGTTTPASITNVDGSLFTEQPEILYTLDDAFYASTTEPSIFESTMTPIEYDIRMDRVTFINSQNDTSVTTPHPTRSEITPMLHGTTQQTTVMLDTTTPVSVETSSTMVVMTSTNRMPLSQGEWIEIERVTDTVTDSSKYDPFDYESFEGVEAAR